MTDFNLGRVQGGSFFYSTASAGTSINSSTLTPSNLEPLIGDCIVFSNGDVYKIINKSGATLACSKVTNIKGSQGDRGLRGYDFQYNWNGTNLGVKSSNEEYYKYVNLKGQKGDSITGPPGPKGDSFQYNWSGTSLGVKTDKQTDYSYVNLIGPKGADSTVPGPEGPPGPPGENLPTAIVNGGFRFLTNISVDFGSQTVTLNDNSITWIYVQKTEILQGTIAEYNCWVPIAGLHGSFTHGSTVFEVDLSKESNSKVRIHVFSPDVNRPVGFTFSWIVIS